MELRRDIRAGERPRSPLHRELVNKGTRSSRVNTLSEKKKQNSLDKNTELGGQSKRSRERRLRRSDQNAEKKNKTFRSQGKKGRGKGGEQCAKRCGEAKSRTEK